MQRHGPHHENLRQILSKLSLFRAYTKNKYYNSVYGIEELHGGWLVNKAVRGCEASSFLCLNPCALCQTLLDLASFFCSFTWSRL